MLLKEHSEWRDEKGNTFPVFPAGSVPSVFRSAAPTLEALEAMASDSRDVRKRLQDWPTTAGVLQLDQLRQVLQVNLVDQIEALKQRAFALGTNFGLVEPGQLEALPQLFRSFLGAFGASDAEGLAEEMAGKMALRFVAEVSPYLLAELAPKFAPWAGLVVGFCQTFTSVISQIVAGSPAVTRQRLPIQRPSRDLDEGYVQEVYNYLTAEERDVTNLFMPAHVGRWEVLRIGSWDAGRGGDWGYSFGRRDPNRDVLEWQKDDDDGFTDGGGMAFMPGCQRIWSSIQWNASRIKNGRNRPANWYMLETAYANKGCFQAEKDFSGSSSPCRQGVPVNSLRGTTRGDVERFPFAPRLTEAVNVGDWYQSTTQALADLFAVMNNPRNPVAWAIDVPTVGGAWAEHFDRFFAEDAQRLWSRHDSPGWRFSCANFFAWMLVSEETGEIAGPGTVADWRRPWGQYFADTVTGKMTGAQLGTFHPGPLGENDPPIKLTPFVSSSSPWERLIRPALNRVGLLQLYGYRTTMVAYLPEKCGAHWDAGAGKLRSNRWGRAYEEGLRDLQTSGRRFSVDMRQVIEPKVRDLLIASGVPGGSMGLGLQAPVTPEKPKPRRVGSSNTRRIPIAGLGDLEVVDLDKVGPVQPLDPSAAPGETVTPPRVGQLTEGGLPRPGGFGAQALGDGRKLWPILAGVAAGSAALGVGAFVLNRWRS